MTSECVRCTLPAIHPLAHLDAEQICRSCRESDHWGTNELQRAQTADEMNILLNETRGPGRFDAVVALSGGKDSSWTLCELARRTPLRLLAVTFDNGFLSRSAIENARRVSLRAKATHEVFAPPVEAMRRLFGTAAIEDLHPETRQGRASGVCNACISLIKLYCLQVAQREQAPLLIWGWSPGQAPLSSALYRPGPAMAEVLVQRQAAPLKKVFPADTPWICEPQFDATHSIPRFVHPLAVWEYDEEEILSQLQEIGWVRPDDVDSTSTNCRLNALGIAIHQRRYGYHPYAHELAGLVRSGVMSQEESRRRQQPMEITPEILKIASELGLTPEIFD